MSEVKSAFYWRELVVPGNPAIGAKRSGEQVNILRRRAQALRRAGWYYKAIAEHLGISRRYCVELVGAPTTKRKR